MEVHNFNPTGLKERHWKGRGRGSSEFKASLDYTASSSQDTDRSSGYSQHPAPWGLSHHSRVSGDMLESLRPLTPDIREQIPQKEKSKGDRRCKGSQWQGTDGQEVLGAQLAVGGKEGTWHISKASRENFNVVAIKKWFFEDTGMLLWSEYYLYKTDIIKHDVRPDKCSTFKKKKNHEAVHGSSRL